MIVRILPDAESDLETIGDFIARDNARRAMSFVAELRNACETIGQFPHAFPLVPRYERTGLRHRVHGNYQIFYRIAERPERVDVLRVIHGARNYPAILFP